MVIGKNIKDMTKAINRIIELQGGICCVENEEILAEVPLPVAGILSEKTVQELGKEVEILREKMSQLGYNTIILLCHYVLFHSQFLQL